MARPLWALGTQKILLFLGHFSIAFPRGEGKGGRGVCSTKFVIDARASHATIIKIISAGFARPGGRESTLKRFLHQHFLQKILRFLSEKY
jgi:hypothetical protein